MFWKNRKNTVISKDENGNYYQSDIGLEAGYDLGLAQLNSRAVGGSKGGVFYLLPLAIRDLNNGESKPFEALDTKEREALEHLYRVIVPGNAVLHSDPPPGPNGLYHSVALQTFLKAKGGWKFPARPLLKPAGEDFVNKRVPRRLVLDMVKEMLAASPKKDRITFDLNTEDGLSAAINTNDPQVLHQIAVFAAAYHEDPFALLTRLIEQPELDRGTAAWLLGYLEARAWLSGTGLAHSTMSPDETEEVLRQICLRSAKLGFGNDVVGHAPELSFAELEAAHAQHGMPEGIPWPSAIVEHAYSDYSPGPYEVGEDGLLVRY